MLQKEFENLMGRKVSTDEYIDANSLYEATDMNKQQFCEAYKRLRDEKLVWELKTTVDHCEARLSNALNDVSKLKDECFRLKCVMKDIAYRMYYKISCGEPSPATRVSLLHWAQLLLPNVIDVIRGKCKYGIELTKEEVAFLEASLEGLYLEKKVNEESEDDLAAIDKMAIG